MPRVDEVQHAGEAAARTGPGVEVFARERLERLDRLLAPARVTIARQVDQIERTRAQLTIRSQRLDQVVVCEARFSGSGAGSCDGLPDERVDERRLPDIGAADQRDFRKAGPGKVGD